MTLVRLSVLEEPLSLAASRSGVDGAAGAVVSIAIVSAVDGALSLPAASVAVAVTLWVPAVRAIVVVTPGEVYCAAVSVPLLFRTPST